MGIQKLRLLKVLHCKKRNNYKKNYTNIPQNFILRSLTVHKLESLQSTLVKTVWLLQSFLCSAARLKIKQIRFSRTRRRGLALYGRTGRRWRFFLRNFRLQQFSRSVIDLVPPTRMFQPIWVIRECSIAVVTLVGSFSRMDVVVLLGKQEERYGPDL